MEESQKKWCPGGYYCDCLTSNKKGNGGFQKLLESKSGLIVYGRMKQDVNKDKKDVIRIKRKVDSLPGYSDDVASPDETKEIQTDGNIVIVIQNTKDNDVNTSEDVLPAFDLNEVSCPRCRHLMIRAKAMLENVPVIEKNKIRCVCDICNLKRQARAPCLHCLNAIKKFKVSGFVDSRKEDVLKKQILTFIKNALQISTTDKQKRDLRAYSDVHIAKIVERRSEQIRLERPKSALILDNTFEFVSDKGIADKLQKKIDEKKVRVTIQVKIPHTYSIPKLYERDYIDSQTEIIRDSLKPIMKPIPQQQAVIGDKKTPYRAGDEAYRLKSDTVLGLGTTGIMRRYHSEESITSFTGIKEKIFKKNFKYFFPRMIKTEKGMYKTSAELIRDTHERFQAETEEKIRKQDELLKIKKEKQLEKSIGREEIQRKIEWAKKKGINLSDIDMTTGKMLLREKGAEAKLREGKHGTQERQGDFKTSKQGKRAADETESEIYKDKRGKMRYKDDAMEKDKRYVAKKDKGGGKGKDQGDVSRTGKEYDSRKDKGLMRRDKGDAGAKDKGGIMDKERAQTSGKKMDKSGKEKRETDKEKGERGMEKGGKLYKGKEEKFTKGKREQMGKETEGKITERRKGDKTGSEKRYAIKMERDAIKMEKGAKGGIDKIKEDKGKGSIAKTSGKETIQKQARGVADKVGGVAVAVVSKAGDTAAKARGVADKVGGAAVAVVSKAGDTAAKARGVADKVGGVAVAVVSKAGDTAAKARRVADKVGGAAVAVVSKAGDTAAKARGMADKGGGAAVLVVSKADGTTGKVGGTTDKAGGVPDKTSVEADKAGDTMDKASGTADIVDKDFPQDSKLRQDMEDNTGVPSEKRTMFQKGDTDDKEMDHKAKKTGLDKSSRPVADKKGQLSAESAAALDAIEKEKIKQAEVAVLNKVIEKQEKERVFSDKFKKKIEGKLTTNKEKAAKATRKLQGYKSKEDLHVGMKEPPTKDMADKQTKQEDVQKAPVVELKKIEMKVSGDDLILKMVKMREERKAPAKATAPIPPLPPVSRKHREKPPIPSKESEMELDADSVLRKRMLVPKEPEIVFGHKIKFVKDVPPEPEPKSVPVLFQSFYTGDNALSQKIGPTYEPESIKLDSAGSFRYALSDRKYIDNGWTMLPTEKIVRKMNVFRMHAAQPEFDWFEHNKARGTMEYCSGEKLAEVDDNGRGRWYYKNGRLALDYYNCEEINSNQRFIIYSSGEPDNRGRSRPITVLAMFDYNGNGVVFDHAGKIRLKYNQNEGVVLDRDIGPVSHWTWHSLNDPPELQQVMIDTQLDFKDPEIYVFDEPQDERQDDENMLAIEFDNFLKVKNKKFVNKTFVPHQINMKTMKINEQFTLKVQDQTRIYLLFREGGTTMKCNLGLKIDHNEIVDTGFCEIGDVSLSVEKLPAETDSIENLQKSLFNARRLNRVQTAREMRKIPHPPSASAERLTAAASRPLRPPPLQMEDLAQSKHRILNANNLYYNTRLI